MSDLVNDNTSPIAKKPKTMERTDDNHPPDNNPNPESKQTG